MYSVSVVAGGKSNVQDGLKTNYVVQDVLKQIILANSLLVFPRLLFPRIL